MFLNMDANTRWYSNASFKDDAYFKIFKFTSEICQTTKQAWDRTTLHQSKINSNAKSVFISNNRKKGFKVTLLYSGD